MEEFSLQTVPTNWVPTGEGSDDSENCVPSREMPEGVVGRSEAVVSTTAMAGVAATAVFAGAVAPADLAGTDVPAVAEVYSSAVDAEDFPLIIQASRRRHAVVGAGHVWPGGETVDLVDDMTVPEPLEHSNHKTLTSVTVGIGWLWTFWTFGQLQPRRVIVRYW